MLKKPKIILPLILLLLSFLVAIRFQNRVPASTVSTIRGAIIPHHLVAKELMVDLGKRLSTASVPNLIIVGPNHDEVGTGHFLTDDPALISDKLIGIDVDNVTRDHACTAPRSVLKKILPATNFSCILVSSQSSLEEIQVLVEKLKLVLGSHGVLVASVDFSHFLSLPEAEANDLLTWGYLSSFDINSLLKLDNHYLDSPRSLSVLFGFVQAVGATTFEKVNHLNSATIMNSPDLTSTTSYFEILYR